MDHLHHNRQIFQNVPTILLELDDATRPDGGGAKTRMAACTCMCKKIDSGTWILSDDLFQAKKAEVTGLAQDTPSQQDRIKVMLDAMKKIIADFEKNNT